MQGVYLPSLSSGIYGNYFYYQSLCTKTLKKDGLDVRCHFVVHNKYDLYISYGTVVDGTTDVIVNAADEYMLGGDGVDGAITAAGGDELDKYRRAVPFVNNDVMNGVRCPTGEARITKTGGSLKCKKYVIHAVGPDYAKMLKFKKKQQTKQEILDDGDRYLYDSYANTMELSKQYNCKSIAFSLISAGIFKGQQDIKSVLRIGAKAIVDHLYDGLETLHMVAFTAHELKILEDTLPTIWTPPRHVYVVDTNR